MLENELKLSGCINNQLKYVGDTAEDGLNKLYKILDILELEYAPTSHMVRQEDIYFDSKDHLLESSGASLRIRNTESQKVLTIKKMLKAQSAVMRREEVELPIPDVENEQQFLTKNFEKYFPQYVGTLLNEILCVYNTRHEIMISTTCSTYKLCFDKFEYYCNSTGEGGDPLYEIEIEQLNGDDIETDSSIGKLSVILTDLMGFSIEKRSKYIKGVDWLKQKEKFENRLFVLFDFVSYSLKPSAIQMQLVREFTKLLQEELSEYDDDCVKIPIGDGVILGFADNINVFSFLSSFSSKLRSYNSCVPNNRRLVIRTAIHYGPIYEYVDINGNPNFAGSGINIVARIGGQAHQNQVLVSNACVNFLKESEGICIQNLDSAQKITVKHDLVLTVHNYYDRSNGVGCPRL